MVLTPNPNDLSIIKSLISASKPPSQSEFEMAVDDLTCMACKPDFFQVREIKQALIQFLTLHAIVIKK